MKTIHFMLSMMACATLSGMSMMTYATPVSSPIFYKNQCVDVSGADQKSVLLYECHGKSNQQFYMNGSAIQQGQLCLDIAQENRENGAKVIAYRCTGKANQQWWIDGYRVRSALNGKCLQADGQNLTMQSCHKGRNQRFIFPALWHD